MIFEDELEEFLLHSDLLLFEKSFFADEFFVEFDAVFTPALVRRRTEEQSSRQFRFSSSI